jgi:hypothetical protein
MPYCLAINVSTSIAVKRKQTSQLLVSEQALSLTDALSSTGCNGLLSGGCRQLKRLPGMTAVGIEILGIEMLGIATLRAHRAARAPLDRRVRALVSYLQYSETSLSGPGGRWGSVVVFGWRALRPPRVVFVIGCVSCGSSPLSDPDSSGSSSF